MQQRGEQGVSGNGVEAAVLSRVAREGPTRKQCLSSAEGEGSVCGEVLTSLRKQQVQRAALNADLSGPGPGHQTGPAFSCEHTPPFQFLLILQVWLICAAHDIPGH